MAAKKTASELKQEGIELGKLIATARKREHNFAMLIASDGVVLEADPRKPSAVMRRQAKANGGSAKGAQGILRVNGKVIELECEEDDPPPMLTRLAKIHFRDRGHMVKIILKTPSGESFGDADDEDTDDEDGAGSAPAEIADAADSKGEPVVGEHPSAEDDLVAELKKTLMAEFEELEPNIERVVQGADKGASKKADALAKLFLTELEKDPKKADKVLSLLKSTLAGVEKVSGGVADDTAGSASAHALPAEDATTTPLSLDEAVANIGQTFGDFWDQVCEPSEGDIALQSERDTIARQREKLAAAYAAGPLDATRLVEIANEFMRLNSMVTTAQQIEAIGRTNPEAATEARQAMAGFDAELGEGTLVTPELLKQLETEKVAAEARLKAAQDQMKLVEAMPDGPDKETARITVQSEMDIAGPLLDAAQTKLRAAKGKKQLTEAITVGPLAPDAPHSFSDQSAAQFIGAFTREPDLASFAIETAAMSQNPDAIASGMDTLCDSVGNGFVDASGNAPPPAFDQTAYARNLINGAGAEGGDYLQDAASYIAKGGHLEANPIPSPSGTDANARSRDRTHFIATNVLTDGGGIDVNSPDAQAALGHLRFSPSVIENPVPEVNRRVADMYEMLGDPTNRARAEGILGGMEAPTGTGAALVGRSAGSGMTILDPDADDARRSVMISMMTPVHQGAVGSCFATAGVRRMSETDPLEVMERYAELAETGEFQPRNGMDAIPAVLSFPTDEDPLIRSLEYSTATVMAGMEGNSRNELLQDALDDAVDGLAGAVGDSNSFISEIGGDNWRIDQHVIRAILIRSFIVEYDAQAQSAEQAADGSSDHGGYFLVQVTPSRRVINTKDLFVEALTERVLTGLGVLPDSDKGKEIASVIASNDYLDEMKSDGDAPWSLGGGGFAVEADEVLFGTERKHVNVIDESGALDAFLGTTRGERTEDLLENMLEQFANADGDMMGIRTVGIHSFNGLPNHPSLAPLQDGGKFEENIEEHLLAPGREIAATPLAEHRTEKLFAEFVARVRSFNGRDTSRKPLIDNAESAGIGTGELTPQQVSAGIMSAFSSYLDQLSVDEAANWQSNEAAAGRVRSDAERDAEAVKIRARRAKLFEGWAVGKLARVTPLPTFTIADTNWGDGTNTTNFVVAPDPRTGEPRLWNQSLPSGNLTLAGDEWEDAQWMEIAVDD